MDARAAADAQCARSARAQIQHGGGSWLDPCPPSKKSRDPRPSGERGAAKKASAAEKEKENGGGAGNTVAAAAADDADRADADKTDAAAHEETPAQTDAGADAAAAPKRGKPKTMPDGERRVVETASVVVRVSMSNKSRAVGKLMKGETVVAAGGSVLETTSGVQRCKISWPLRGWVTASRLRGADSEEAARAPPRAAPAVGDDADAALRHALAPPESTEAPTVEFWEVVAPAGSCARAAPRAGSSTVERHEPGDVVEAVARADAPEGWVRLAGRTPRYAATEELRRWAAEGTRPSGSLRKVPAAALRIVRATPAGVAATRPPTIRAALAASPRPGRRRSTWHSRRRRDPAADDPRGTRGVAATRPPTTRPRGTPSATGVGPPQARRMRERACRRRRRRGASSASTRRRRARRTAR